MNTQSEIFSRYRSLFNSNSVRPLESETSRKINNMDFVDFLFELVKATKGQKQFKNIILKGSLSKLKKTDELNKIIKKAIIAIFGCDNGLIIPTKYTTKSSLGIELFKSEIDAFGLFGIDPEISPGNYMYEGNDITKHINFLLYKAQGFGVNNPISFIHENKTLFEVYSKNPNVFVFKFGEFYENKFFAEWLLDYIKIVSPVFNIVNFTATLTDILTGAISIRTGKTKIEIRQQTRILKSLKKIFGFCSESPSDNENISSSANNILNDSLEQNYNFNGENLIGTPKGIGFYNEGSNSVPSLLDLNPFDFDFNELKDIEEESDLRYRGVIKFSTCGDLELNVNSTDILSGLDLLLSVSNVDDVYSYDGTFENEIPPVNQVSSNYDNSNVIPNSDKAADFFDNAIKKGATEAINQGETNIIVDLPAINAELQLNILKSIPYALMQMVLTPKITIIPKLFTALTGDLEKKSSEDFINKMKPVISNVGSQITTLLVENIFDAIKADLTKLAKNLAISYLKQRGIDYLATLRSLLRLLGLLTSRERGCASVLSKLLKLLKLSNFGPMPMLPPPLIFLAGAIKPGMNSVAIINDIKSTLTEKGIETAPTLPDGTPNNMMIAIEETVRTMVTHLKTNSTIQTFGISAAGPVSGYGQIQ